MWVSGDFVGSFRELTLRFRMDFATREWIFVEWRND